MDGWVGMGVWVSVMGVSDWVWRGELGWVVGATGWRIGMRVGL